MIDGIFVSTLLSAVVVVVCGVLFLLETLLRRDTGAGRVWSLAFLSGILTTICYLLWSLDTPVAPAWVAVAVGNGAFVGTVGCLWLGARSFNRRRQRVSAPVVAAVCLLTVVAALVQGPQGGDWAGALPMFLALAGFAGLGGVETRRGALGATLVSFGLTTMLAVTTGYYLCRALVFVSAGPQSETFVTWFGNLTTAVLTIVLTIVAMLTGSILRNENLYPGLGLDATPGGVAVDGVLDAVSFETAIQTVGERARRNNDLLALIALRMDDLPQIGTAFGSAAQAEVAVEWIEGVRRYAPAFSLVAEGGPTTVLVAVQPSSVGDARRTASRVHRKVLDEFAARPDTPMPVVGVGVALSETFGYEPAALRRAAEDAAFVSASSPDASVIMAGPV